MEPRSVFGSYAGAIWWEIYDDRDAKELAHSLAQSCGCAYYNIDGEWFGPFPYDEWRSNDKENTCS